MIRVGLSRAISRGSAETGSRGRYSTQTGSIGEGSAFGSTRAAKAKWFAKAAAGSVAVGAVLSSFVLTDEVLESASKRVSTVTQIIRNEAKSRFGIDLPVIGAQAFSTADNGLHAPHHPWDNQSWWKAYDHSA